tara:strand:- start:940 stop:1461 length:522 start_codon:yes stop_codon:yes gene_type:complete
MNKVRKKIEPYILPICLILVLAFTRLIPHPSNFTPVLALGIFSGFYFRNFILSFFIVISSMFIGDLFLGFHNTMFFTYSSLAVAVLVGIFLKNFGTLGITLGGLASSIAFFLVTNFGAWVTLDMYEKNFEGLIQSYFLAIPFFHNTLISTFLYLFLIKIIFELLLKKRVAINN